MPNEQKEQEIVLPPLDAKVERWTLDSAIGALNCRERQLLQALRDLAAAREQYQACLNSRMEALELHMETVARLEAEKAHLEAKAFNEGVKEAAAQFNACRSHCGYDSNAGIQRWLNWAHSEMLALKRPTQ